MSSRTVHSKYLFKDYKMPTSYDRPIIIGYNIRTPENIGSIIRLADNVACLKVIFITDKSEVRLSKVKKTAASSYTSVDWKFCSLSEFEHEIPKDYTLIALETTSDSENIYNLKLPSKVAFVLGNEISGIEEEFLDKCQTIVHIPIYGKNTSLNVSHSLAIALFEWQRQISNSK